MIRVQASVTMPASAADAWALLTDWPSHSRWIPATVVTVTEQTGGVGTRFVGRTGVGPLAFDDPMTVTVFEPPVDGRSGRCEVEKTGRVVLGAAGFVVRADGPTACTVTWWEDVTLAPEPLTRYAEPLVARAAQRQLAQVLRAVAAELAARPDVR